MIRREGLIISIYVTLLVIVVNGVLTIYYRNVIEATDRQRTEVLAVNHGIEFMNKYVNLADLGLRGYMIDQDNKFLTPYTEAIASYQKNFDSLRVVLKTQGYDLINMDPAERAVDRYMKLVIQMVEMCKVGDVDQAVEILKKDPGYDAWKIYSVFERDVLNFEDKISQKADTDYKTMMIRMVIFQLLLLLVGVPILIIVVKTIKRARRIRHGLFKKLIQSNKKYVFDDGSEHHGELAEGEIINDMIGNLKHATQVISNISKGNYDVKWEGISKENAALNKKNIAGELINMRDQMKKVKQEDDVRLWTTEGLSKFAEIVRNRQDDFNRLSVEIVTNIVSYLKAQQGGIFIVNSANEQDQYLELMGCYAYDRVKAMEKRIEFGQGLVGQCFLEQETIYMTNVPQEFVHITSGLGDTRPNCILIVPLRVNDKTEGVIELASLKPFEPHEIAFVEKLGETIASAIISVKSAANMKELLEQSQQQAEEMRAQEEEMRQNMEELQATQEQMQRKNDEVEELLRKTEVNR